MSSKLYCKKPQFWWVFPLTEQKMLSKLQPLHNQFKYTHKKGKIVNKNDLIASVASAANISKADAAQAVDGVFNAITESLSSGDEVRLVGFGTFSVAERAASEGRNPRTGEKIQNG